MPAPTNRPTWWPLPDDEPLGEERARELVAWLETVTRPAVQAARYWLQAGDPSALISTDAVPAAQLATHALAAGMRGLPIGSVSAPATRGAHPRIGIALQRDGRLALTVRDPGKVVQRWIVVGDTT